MIEIKNISKSFDEKKVLEDISLKIADGSIFGIVGSNGAGKSTLLRMMSGVYDVKDGSVLYGGVELGNKIKNTPNILFLSDDMYYETSDTIESMGKRYRTFYKEFECEKFEKLLNVFGLEKKTRMEKLSKGMKNQALLSAALASNAKYLLLDETLDGLDPLMRINAKKIIFDETIKREMVTVITSHSLKELEDMCDNLSMLHEGKIILQGNIDEFKANIVKIRCAFDEEITKDDFEELDIESFEKSGKIYTIIANGDKEIIMEKINKLKPILVEVFPVTIEEIFVIKLKQLGYGDKLEWRID